MVNDFLKLSNSFFAFFLPCLISRFLTSFGIIFPNVAILMSHVWWDVFCEDKGGFGYINVRIVLRLLNVFSRVDFF